MDIGYIQVIQQIWAICSTACHEAPITGPTEAQPPSMVFYRH